MRPATTKICCPKCKSRDFLFLEVGTWSSEFVVRDGKLDRSEGNHEPESVDRLEGKCSKCQHHWKVRGAAQIDDAVSETSP
jgi:hypothetical protein